MGRLVEATFFPQGSEAIEQKPRILIIDDSRGFTRAAKRLLKKTGSYYVCEENDATKAHQTAQRFKPDLILLDISMPAGNGFVVAERIHKILSPQPPIIFLTASKRREIRERAQKLGAAGYFEKPYEAADLLAAVDKILNAEPATAD